MLFASCGGGGLWGLLKARLRPRELAADIK